MKKLLLTSGQVSVLFSSTIVCTFTLLLFLAGYILQQQTVHALQATLKPIHPTNPNPAPQVPLAATLQSSPKFGGSIGSNGHVAFQSYLAAQDVSASPADWNKLAHVQVVKDHSDVCSAVMLLAELHRLRSPARKILLFPQIWAADMAPGKGASLDPFTMSTRRLLKLAARRYRVELHPIGPLVEGGNADSASSYSLASIFALSGLERAMLVQGPGLLFDTEMLDQLLAYTPPSTMAISQKDTSIGLEGGEILLLSPGKDTYAALRASEKASTATDLDLLHHVLPPPYLLNSSSSSSSSSLQISKSISTLHDIPPSTAFNATDFLATTSYILFSDPKLPKGPEYEVPYMDRVNARPKNKDADWVWTKLYGLFAMKRMEVCGLDLEVYRDWEWDERI
ncbi:hypothetical protein BDV97DRAFT_402617 [Delphinella strobiligena]|nr:hypothetical protein BDV97DRAFT_402617 [Delphinella strobiligena]